MDATTPLRFEIGQSNFEDLLTNGGDLIDKSRFIPEILAAAKVVLIARPRRFGKTFTLSMLRSFLSLDFKNPADRSLPQRLFEKLAVARKKRFVEENMGRWPVIHLTLKDVRGRNFESAVAQFKFALLTAAKPFAFLAESEDLNPVDQEAFARLLNIGTLGRKEAEPVLTRSLAVMASVLHAHYGRKAVVLIDEYDTPLTAAAAAGYFAEMSRLLSGLFSSGLKDAPHLHKALLTGCLKPAKRSALAGVDTLRSFGVTEVQLRDAVGFTEEEVQKILLGLDLQDSLEVVHEHYDGWRFGGTRIFSPWDVLNFCADRTAGEAVPGNYWVETSANDLLEEFIDHADETHLEIIRGLLKGEGVAVGSRNEVSLDDLNGRRTPGVLLNLLLHAGYLTETAGLQGGPSRRRIPNEEIRGCWREKVRQCFTADSPAFAKVGTEFFDALIAGRRAKAQSILQNQLTRFIHLNEADAEAQPGGLVQSLLEAAATPFGGRMMISDLEPTEGFCSIVIADDEPNTAVVLALRLAAPSTAGPEEEHLEAACRAALDQINARRAASDLGEFKVVRRAGLAFSGKHCLLLMT